MLKLFYRLYPIWHDNGLIYSCNKSYYMKRILVITVIAFALATTGLQADAQPPHAKAWGKKKKGNEWKKGQYYYYPSANVYYNPAANRYWYPKNGSWTNIDILPPSVVVYNQPRRIVYRESDDDIWRDNKVHFSKYRGLGTVTVEKRRKGKNKD